jgi:hypothetical protein
LDALVAEEKALVMALAISNSRLLMILVIWLQLAIFLFSLITFMAASSLI